MKTHLYTICLVGIILCLMSCNRRSPDGARINEADTYIEEDADSALSVLQAIDPTRLTSDSEKARHALLLSMALDKNLIDRTDFAVLQPAIDYYARHGNATDKLRTLYYQGRIYFNQGDMATAMSYFNRALNEGKSSDDIRTKARTHYARSTLYHKLYKMDRFVEENRLAAELFKQVHLTNSYANCLTRIINGYTLLDERENAKRYIRLCKPILDSLSLQRRGAFYDAYLEFLFSYGSDAELKSTLEEYYAAIPVERLDWVTIAHIHCRLHDPQTALQCILRHRLDGTPTKKRVRYYAVLSRIYQELHAPQEALDAYIHYSQTSDSLDLVAFKQDTKFIEDYHKLELDTVSRLASKNRIITATVIALFLLFAICISIYIRLTIHARKRKMLEIEREQYRLQCLQIEEERDNLTRLITHNNEMDESVHAALTERITFLNRFFAQYIKQKGDPDDTLMTEVEQLLANRDAFMTSTRLAFTASHPQFIHHLQTKGLTEWEISYCCLYALGLNGKEVGAYIKMRSHYNQSSIIREKLGIGEHDTNLGIYLRKLLNQFSL